MSLVNPIPDESWLKKNRHHLNISDKTYNELLQIYKLVDSTDWLYSRIYDDAYLIERINKFHYLDTSTTVSVVYIVKNEEQYIVRSLESISDFADEIIIVDTGSTDNTVNVINDLSNEKISLYTFDWCDDFSKARNYANEKATCDWLLVLDADEVIDDARHLKSLLSYLILFDNFDDTVFNFNVSRENDSYKTGKLIRNTGIFTFKGRVHESYDSISGQIYYANIDINVIGEKRYCDEKINYYNQLLLRTMEEYPKESRWCYYFFRDNYTGLSLNQMLLYGQRSIFKEGIKVSQENFISNYFSVRIVVFLLLKMLEEDNHTLFDDYLMLLEEIVPEHSDVIFLKFARYLKGIQKEILNLTELFLKKYEQCTFLDSMLSSNCIHSLLGSYLFLSGFFKESRQIFRELQLDGEEYPHFINQSFIDYFQEIK